MTHYGSGPLRTASGRPLLSQSNDLPGLPWLFLLLILGGLLVARSVGEVLTADATVSSRLVRALGSGAPKRLQMDSVPSVANQATAVAEVEFPMAVAETPPASEAAPALNPTPVADRFRVANTDGLGLVLYTAPRRDARVPRGLLEGTHVTVLERVGSEWARVRADNGQEGWVSAAYLDPAE